MLEMKRRRFLQELGGGLLVMLSGERDAVAAQESGGGRRAPHELPASVSAWLHIGQDGRITAFTGKVEVGQNIRTSLTQAVADEMRCPASSVTLVMGDTSLVPWDMGTFGSRTTPTMAPEMRKMAATAREALLAQAAKIWNLPEDGLKVGNGFVSAGDKRLSFGELAPQIGWVDLIGNADLITVPPHWELAGTDLPKIDAREMVTGKHKYVSDLRVPGMLYGRVLRGPSQRAKLVSVDTAAAARMPGVVVARDGDFVGVAAADERAAEKALAAIEAKWSEPAAEETALGSSSGELAGPGDHTRVSAKYQVAYIAHVPLEPRAALAQWNGAKLTVLAGTQVPFGVRSELAAAFGLPETDVRVRVPDTGSGYGGKHSGECAVEAARLAKAAGKPVKLIWTREEEFNWAYVRPAGTIMAHSAVDSQGKIVQWDFTNFASGPAGLKSPYAVPEAHKSETFVEGRSPLRQGSYRGLASTANHFARESHIDEIAAKLGVDPLDFRLNNLENDRLRNVLQAAAGKFEWRKQKATASRGFGLACGFDKGGHIACCVEIAISPSRQIAVERVVAAWDCGAIVNPNHLRNQVEGALVMGLGGALFEEIEHTGGKIHNPRLSQYRVPRFSDMPKIDVILIDRRDVPSAGAGETPIVGIAPALAGAIFSATGLRIRSLPLLPALAKA